MNLGKQIRQIRQLREYSQEYLGSETGIGQIGISRIENNKISPNYSQLQKIAKVLEIDIILLLSFDVESYINMLTYNLLNNYGERGGNMH